MKITGNEPANPASDHNHLFSEKQPFGTGLTIRQQFAMVAMQGLIAGCDVNAGGFDAEWTAKASINAADKLIAELNRTDKP